MHTFKKEERLANEKAIEQLFEEGRRFFLDPFMVVSNADPFESRYPARALISVPRKKIRGAVKRNLIKRRIREAYRLHKGPFYDALSRQGSRCTLALVYTSGVLLEYSKIEQKIILILQRLQREYEKADR